jgi:hypothetical protein
MKNQPAGKRNTVLPLQTYIETGTGHEASVLEGVMMMMMMMRRRMRRRGRYISIHQNRAHHLRRLPNLLFSGCWGFFAWR